MTSETSPGKSGSILKELIFNQYQAILLGGAAATSLIMMNPLPLIALIGGEFITLPILDSVPALRRRMQRRRNAKEQKEAEERRAAVIASFHPSAARRYLAMEDLCKQIEANYQGLSGISQAYLIEQRQKLDMILEGCMHRMTALQRYERMLAGRDPSGIEAEITRLEYELRQSETTDRARTALRNNIELKKRLLTSYTEARGTMKALALELDSMVSLLEVLHQNSISMRDPQAIASELDTIVRQSEDSERAVREMEALLQSDLSLGSDIGESADRKVLPLNSPRKLKGR
jgi:hypothetical protein